MNVLLWLIAIWLGFSLFFRLFGRQLLQLGAKKIIQRLQHQQEAQRKAYEAHFEAGHMREHVYADEEIKVTSPKGKSKQEVHLEDFAQDVDFEEVNER